jgi:hypothetical protein
VKSRYLKVSAIAIFIILILNYAIGIIFLNFGNPIRLLICKYKLEKYSKAVYGENAKLYELPKYNLKDGEYHCKLVRKDNGVLSELTYISPKGDIRDSNFTVDTDLKNKITSIKNQLGKDIYLPHPDMFYVIDGKQDFSKQPLKRIDKLYLLGITNIDVELTPEQSKERFFQIIASIYKSLGDEYNFTSSQLIYVDINGVLETNISSNESKMSYHKIKSKIKQNTAAELESKLINQLKAVKNGQLTKDKLGIPYRF